VQANSQTIRDQPCAATALIAPARLAAVWDSAPGRGRRQRITAGSDADPETVRRPRDVKRAREVRSCRDRPGDPPQLALGRRDPRVSPPGCPTATKPATPAGRLRRRRDGGCPPLPSHDRCRRNCSRRAPPNSRRKVDGVRRIRR